MVVRYNFCDVRSKDAAIIMCILSSLSKIYEYVVFEQLLLYMEDNGLFYNDQFRFRPGHSTDLASVRFVDTLVQQMDNFNIPISILIDLSEAFDTLDHNIVLSKLRHYGVTGIELDFFTSYLLGRVQYVEYSGVCSQKLPISTGVPQGSVLGPPLFLIYINDLPTVSNIFNFHILMYADGTKNKRVCLHVYIYNIYIFFHTHT